MEQRQRIGISGFQGSFSHQACHLYCEDHGIEEPEIVYLYRTEKVLGAVSAGEVDFGVFALLNSLSGVIMESLEAMGEYLFFVQDVFDMPVTYSLMAKKVVTLKHITTIISHPAILEACEGVLSKHYPDKQLSSGEGILMDQAAAAAYLAEPGSPDTVAVLAPKICGDLYSLSVLVSDIGAPKNTTTFVWCKKR